MSEPSFGDLRAAQAALLDPSTSPADLASIAQAQPALRILVAGHSNAYPALLDWLSRNGDDAVKAAVANRRSAEFAPPPPPSSPSSSPVPAPAAGTVTRTPRKKKAPILVGAGVIVVVVAVVVGLVLGGVFKKAPSLSVDQYKSMLANVTETGYKPLTMDNDTLFNYLYSYFNWRIDMPTSSCQTFQSQVSSTIREWTWTVPHGATSPDDMAWLFGRSDGNIEKSDLLSAFTSCSESISDQYAQSDPISRYSLSTATRTENGATIIDFSLEDYEGSYTYPGILMYGNIVVVLEPLLCAEIFDNQPITRLQAYAWGAFDPTNPDYPGSTDSINNQISIIIQALNQAS